MGDAIDNPYRKIHGTKNLSLKDIHNPHYIVLLAIDEPRQEVIVANPFGYTQTLPFKEFWERISLDPKYVHAHSIYSLLIESGLYIPRSCVIVSKNP
jgi:hypothetical protein